MNSAKSKNAGMLQRTSLWEARMKANRPCRKGFMSPRYAASPAMPRTSVLTFRENSFDAEGVARMLPDASGSDTARYPRLTVCSTERKSGAIPGRK